MLNTVHRLSQWRPVFFCHRTYQIGIE